MVGSFGYLQWVLGDRATLAVWYLAGGGVIMEGGLLPGMRVP